jgi:photosystem II stability/assembly factor-like uncharacterized protein
MTLESLSFCDPSDGWAVGQTGGMILVTSNSREIWKAQSSDTTSILLTSLQFLDARRGWVAGDKRSILATTDGSAKGEPQFIAN